MKLVVALAAILLLFAAAACLWLRLGGDVSHAELEATVAREAQSLREQAERNFDALSRENARLDRKLDRIEGKLDRLLEIAERPLPDGMQKAN